MKWCFLMVLLFGVVEQMVESQRKRADPPMAAAPKPAVARALRKKGLVYRMPHSPSYRMSASVATATSQAAAK
jgi:hypothetical protein